MSTEGLHRLQSGCDLQKARKQQMPLSLEPSPNTVPDHRQKQCFNLVVCGAVDPTEGFFFSDFMGFCMALKEHGVGGDFYSCFPLDQHFAYLSSLSPIVDTIKFGSYGPDKKKCLYSYSRYSYAKREYWWKQVGSNIIYDMVKTWIQDKQQKAQEGDVVNIIFEGHGSKSNFHLGNSTIHRYDFRDWVAAFAEGVHISVISGACYSGAFSNAIQEAHQKDRYFAAATGPETKSYSCSRSVSNRIRNSRFAQAFVLSLAKLNLPDVPRRKATWRLRDHEAFMKEQLTRNITPGANIVEPHFYGTVDGFAAIEEMVFRDKIDVLYDPRVSARRKRIEWPTLDPNIWNSIQSGGVGLPGTALASAKAVVDSEMAKCDTRMGFKPDIPVYDQVYVRNPNYRMMLRNLYWRARRQSAVWDVFELLISRGFLHASCLIPPLNLWQPSKDSLAVSNFLIGFSYFTRDTDLVFKGKIPLQTTEWDADIQWLATMIVRSGVKLDKLFDTIEACGFLGEYDPEDPEFSTNSSIQLCLTQSMHDSSGVEGQEDRVASQKNQFGFWLPHGLSQDLENFVTQLYQCKETFNRIEEAFRETENLSQEKLWLESEQAEFFDRHPERYPSGTYDIPQGHLEWAN